MVWMPLQNQSGRCLLSVAVVLALAMPALGADDWVPVSYLPLSGTPCDLITGRRVAFVRESVAFGRDGTPTSADVMRTELFAVDGGWAFEWIPTPEGKIRPFAADGCLIYGARSSSVYTTTDGYEWSFAASLPDCVMQLFVTHTGAVLASLSPQGSGRLYRSDPGAGDFEHVLDLEEGILAMWNFADTGTHLFISEYGPKYGPNARRIYRSGDDGRTWELVYDSEHRNTHNHRLVWDPYAGRLIQATGDGIGNRLFIISDDNGETWRVEPQHLYKPMGGLAQAEAVYWGMDGRFPCGVARQARGTDRWELVFTTGVGEVRRDDQFQGNTYDIVQYEGILYAPLSKPYASGESDSPALYTSIDGEHWVLSRRFGLNEFGIRAFLGECGGRLRMRYIQGQSGEDDQVLLAAGPPETHRLVRGARFEEAVTNLWNSPETSSAEGGIEDWVSFNGASVEPDSEVTWHGERSIHVTCREAAPAGVTLPTHVGYQDAGTRVSVLVHLYGPPRALRLEMLDDGHRRIGHTVFYDTSYRWSQAFCTVVLPNDTTELSARISQAEPYPELEFWVDGVMLSVGPGGDTWQVGGEPRAADRCTYDFQFPPVWTDVFLWAPDPGTDGPVAGTRALKVYEAADGSRLSVFYDPSVDHMRLVDSDDSSATISTPPFQLAQHAVLRCGVVQSETSRTLCVKIAEDPFVASVAAPPRDIVRFHLGSVTSSRPASGGLQARHKLFDRAANVEELEMLFDELVRSPDPADYDANGRVDLVDFARFQECLTGPGGAYQPDCQPGDVDEDGDIDLDDFRILQLLFAAP
jgi:hypothetical protein